MRTLTFAWFILVPLASVLSAAEPVDYLRDVKPIFKERCYACHGALRQRSQLRVDTGAALRKGGRHGPAVAPGDAAGSVLVERVADPDETTRMPPEGKPLTEEQLALIQTWINQGAHTPADETPEEDPRRHWAFLKPVRPEIPVVPEPAWTSNPIDRFLAAAQTRRGLTPCPPTDRATLLRRVHLDLVGLPPARAELHAFLADSAPDAYEKVVDRLLSSPHYGERWARHWMDVWRYSDWYGRRSVPDVMNSYAQIWRWRDWIVHSLNEDRGYDHLVTEMLAADEVCPEDDRRIVATGFLVRNWFKWNYNQWMRDNVEHTAKAFLGLTLNCCHCHDHKYDPISQEEYFRFRAFFEPLELRHGRWPGEADPGPFQKYVYGKAYGPIKSGLIRVFDEKPEAATYFYTGGDERNRVPDRAPVPPGVPAALGGAQLKIEPVALPPSAYYPGLKEFVQEEERDRRQAAVTAAAAALRKTPADGPATARLAAAEAELRSVAVRIAADNARFRGGPGNADVLARVAARAEREANLAAAEEKVMTAESALAAAKAKGDAKATAQFETQRAAARKAVESARQARVKDDAAYTPLSPVYPKTSSGRRTALARWIASPENPLTARVAVNHLWAWHFGRPLVETTNNFGRGGKKPTFPELLDWLAVELMDNGWRMKALHRLMVASSAYRMQSQCGDPSHAGRTLDPDNLFLWHFPTARMEAEVVRDSILHAAGELDLTVGGPEIPHEQGLTSRRRSLYFAYHGESRMQFLELFDAANPCDAYRRTTSVLPQQALALSNSALALRQSRLLAHKLLAGTEEAFVRSAFEQVLGRAPTPAETKASLAFLARQVRLLEASAAEVRAALAAGGAGLAADPAQRARANLVHALYNHNDFVTIR